MYLRSLLSRRLLLAGVLSGSLLVALILFGQTPPSSEASAIAQAGASVPTAPGTTLRQSDDSGLQFDVIVPQPELALVPEAGGEGVQIRLPGYGYLGDVGAPDLPQMGIMIALPPGAVPVVSVVTQTSTVVSNQLVAPAADQNLISYELGNPDSLPVFQQSFNRDDAIYSQDAFYPASVVSPGAITQIRGLTVVNVFIRPVQYNPQTQSIRYHSQLRVQIDFTYPNGRPTVTPVSESAAFDALLGANILNFDQARAWQGAMTVLPELGAPPMTSPCLDDNALRVTVTQTGIHAISFAELSAAGFPSGIAETRVRMCYEDSEIAIRIENNNASTNMGTGDNVIFYGQAIKTQETTDNVYWLTYSSAGPNGLRMASANGTPAGATTPTQYTYTIHVEEDNIYRPNLPMFPQSGADINDHWYWGRFGHNLSGISTTIDVPFWVDDPAAGAYDVAVTIEVWGGIDLDNHLFRFKINSSAQPFAGAFFGSGRWVDHRYLFQATFPSNLLVDGANTLTIEALDNDPGDPNSNHLMNLNWVEIQPDRKFEAVSGRIAFSQPITNTAFNYAVTGWAATRTIYDVTDTDAPFTITGSSVGGLTQFQRTSGATTTAYEIVTNAGRRSVAAVSANTLPSPLLQDASRQASYIIITDPAFANALTPLVTHRQSVGEQVTLVYVQDIFDEFSYGRYDPEAIRRFLAHAATTWAAPAPTYVLLAGSGSYDHRDLSGDNGPLDNAVPVFLRSGVDNNIGETAADNQYVEFNGDELADMLLGRLPADTTAELATMINRIIARETEAPAAWRGTHLFVVDNGYLPPNPCTIDGAGDFFLTVDTFLANVFPGDRQFLNRLYYAPTNCYPNGSYPTYLPHYQASVLAMTSGIYDNMNQGAGVVVYTGHSGVNFWGHEDYFNTTIAGDELTNGARPSIMLPMTCLEGQYHFPGSPGLSETLMQLPAGGAVASYAPTGLQVQKGHDFLIRGWYGGVFTDSVSLMGQAVFSAKLTLFSDTVNFQDLHDTFMLLGDPAMDTNLWELHSEVNLPVAIKD